MLCFLRKDFQEPLILRVPAVAKGGLCHQGALLLPGMDGMLDFLAGIFDIALIEPCFDANGIVAGIPGIVMVVNDNQAFLAFLELIQKQENLGVVPAQPGKILQERRSIWKRKITKLLPQKISLR